MDDSVARSLAPRRFGLRVLTFFAVTALFLAALGIYGVVSYSVAQRTREIGIRVALGAARSAVLRLVLAQGTRLSLFGVLLGIIVAVPALRLIEGQLYGTNLFEPETFLATAATVLAAALLASYLPARRALRVDPALTLNCE
jgi:putative ABC transport system permease protein